MVEQPEFLEWLEGRTNARTRIRDLAIDVMSDNDARSRFEQGGLRTREEWKLYLTSFNAPQNVMDTFRDAWRAYVAYKRRAVVRAQDM